MRLLGKRLLVKPILPETETASGLILPPSAQAQQQSQGTVVTVGSDVTGVKKGDTVVYGKFAGQMIELEDPKSKIKRGIEHVVIKEDDILVVL